MANMALIRYGLFELSEATSRRATITTEFPEDPQVCKMSVMSDLSILSIPYSACSSSMRSSFPTRTSSLLSPDDTTADKPRPGSSFALMSRTSVSSTED